MILTLTAVVTSTYAYWNSLQKTEDETLIVGEGIELVVDVNLEAPAGKVLVPAGLAYGINDVDSITITYDAILDAQATNDMTLSVIATDIKIDGVDTYSSLVNVNITLSTSDINSSSSVLVTIVVTLTEPSNETEYDAIVNKPITFNLVFTATPNA